jgi:hypothetical protein
MALLKIQSSQFQTLNILTETVMKSDNSAQYLTCYTPNMHTTTIRVLISNFGRVLNVVCFLLGNSPASKFYMPTFRNTLFHLHRQVGVKND